MKAVFKLMMFSFVLNLAVGVMSQALPSIANDPTFNPLEYDASASNDFAEQINKTISPSGDLEDSSNAFDRLLDKIGLGVAKKFLNVVDTYMFGFVQVIERLFGNTNLWLSGFLRILIIVGYAFGAIWLWTGKDVGRG